MNKKFNIDSSLQVNKKMIVQGDLEVRGSTTTVDQQTLAVKDNIIITNADGGAVPDTGVVAISGNMFNQIKSGTNAVFDFLSSYPSVSFYATDFSGVMLYKLGDTNEILIDNVIAIECASNSFIDVVGFLEGNRVGLSLSRDTGYNLMFLQDSPVKISGDGTIEDFCSAFNIPMEKVSKKEEAYAAPIYVYDADDGDGALKIGQGYVVREADGSVSSFEFVQDQAQSIATRADKISDKQLLQWDDLSHTIVGSDFSLKSGESTAAVNMRTGDDPNVDYVNRAIGKASFAIGDGNKTIGAKSFAGGTSNQTLGNSSASFGQTGIAYNSGTFTMGNGNKAYGAYSAAIGYQNVTGDIVKNEDGSPKYFYKQTSVTDKQWIDPTTGQQYANGTEITDLTLLDTINWIYHLSGTNHEDNVTIDTYGNATYSGWGSTAFGQYTIAGGSNSFAAGYRTQALGKNSVALGGLTETGSKVTKAAGYASFASGAGSEALGNYSFVHGYKSKGTQNGSIVFGSSCEVTGEWSLAGGNSCTASGNNSLSFGSECLASGYTSVALGNACQATNQGSVAVGYTAKATGQNAVAIGLGTASGINSFVSGNAASASSYNAIAIGPQATVKNDRSVAIGDSATIDTGTTHVGQLALGYQTKAGAESVAVGRIAKATGNLSCAFGRAATSSNSYAISLGNTVTTSGVQALGVGNSIVASGEKTVAIGTSVTASKRYDIGIGYNITTPSTDEGKVLIGNNLKSNSLQKIILGQYNSSTGSEYFTIANGTSTAGKDIFTVSSTGFVSCLQMSCSSEPAGDSNVVTVGYLNKKLSDLDVEVNNATNSLNILRHTDASQYLGPQLNFGWYRGSKYYAAHINHELVVGTNPADSIIGLGIYADGGVSILKNDGSRAPLACAQVNADYLNGSLNNTTGNHVGTINGNYFNVQGGSGQHNITFYLN